MEVVNNTESDNSIPNILIHQDRLVLNSHGETPFPTSSFLYVSLFLVYPFAKSSAFQQLCPPLELLAVALHGAQLPSFHQTVWKLKPLLFKTSKYLLNNENFRTTCPSFFSLSSLVLQVYSVRIK